MSHSVMALNPAINIVVVPIAKMVILNIEEEERNG